MLMWRVIARPERMRMFFKQYIEEIEKLKDLNIQDQVQQTILYLRVW